MMSKLPKTDDVEENALLDRRLPAPVPPPPLEAFPVCDSLAPEVEAVVETVQVDDGVISIVCDSDFCGLVPEKK